MRDVVTVGGTLRVRAVVLHGVPYAEACDEVPVTGGFRKVIQDDLDAACFEVNFTGFLPCPFRFAFRKNGDECLTVDVEFEPACTTCTAETLRPIQTR